MKEHEQGSLACLRCQTELTFLGTQSFHEGSRALGFWLGDLGRLFENSEKFNVFACPTCGKVEFFISRAGEISTEQDNGIHL